MVIPATVPTDDSCGIGPAKLLELVVLIIPLPLLKLIGFAFGGTLVGLGLEGLNPHKFASRGFPISIGLGGVTLHAA